MNMNYNKISLGDKVRIKIFLSAIILGLSFSFLFQNCGKKSYSQSNEVQNSLDEEQEPEFTDPEETTDSESQALLDQAESTCHTALINHFTAKDIIDGNSLVGIKNGFYKGHDVSAIRDGWGNIVISASGVSPAVHEISNYKGNIVLCGLGVESVNNFLGNIFVVDANVGEAHAVKGNIIIKRGVLNGAVSGSKMNLIILPPAGHFSRTFYNQ